MAAEKKMQGSVTTPPLDSFIDFQSTEEKMKGSVTTPLLDSFIDVKTTESSTGFHYTGDSLPGSPFESLEKFYVTEDSDFINVEANEEVTTYSAIELPSVSLNSTEKKMEDSVTTPPLDSLIDFKTTEGSTEFHYMDGSILGPPVESLNKFYVTEDDDFIDVETIEEITPYSVVELPFGSMNDTDAPEKNMGVSVTRYPFDSSNKNETSNNNMESSTVEPPRRRVGRPRKNINAQKDKAVNQKPKRKYVRRKDTATTKPQRKRKATTEPTYPVYPTCPPYHTEQPICVNSEEFVDLLIARKEQGYPNMPGYTIHKRVDKTDNETKEINITKEPCDDVDAVDDGPGPSFAYKHLSSPTYENWLFNGVLPAVKYDKETPVSTNRSDVLKKVHDLTGNLIEVKESIKSLKVKTEIAKIDEDPKLHLWAHKWDEKESNNEKLESIKKASGIQEEVTKEVCKRNLLDHVTTQQKAVENILNEMEGNVKALEAKMKADNIPPLDLETFKKIFQH